MKTHTMSPLNFISPWLAQLKDERPHFKLEKDTDCDIAVVGAGIAGVSTVYQLLKHTDASVMLIDAGRIAHGATGRNAGQVTNCFERPFGSIIEEFGVDMAREGHMAVESAWGILNDIQQDCALTTPLYRCTGYTGIVKPQELIEYLEEQKIYADAGLKPEPILVSESADIMKDIPAELHGLATLLPHSMVLKTLDTDDTEFIASATGPIGCTNSALLCEELVMWMKAHFKDRLIVAEHLPVTSVTLSANSAVLTTQGPTVNAKRVVLCTNGFENFTIKNLHGPEIDTSFHATVLGKIAYMTGYLDEAGQDAAAISYNNSSDVEGNPYYYLTRRPFEHSKHGRRTLLCMGGPERDLPNDAMYDPNVDSPSDITHELDSFVRQIYNVTPETFVRTFVWQGLMGHTPNRLRRVGFEPKNNVLLYNLGCNGVGILPSIYGGKRIMQLIRGAKLKPSIFDPIDG